MHEAYHGSFFCNHALVSSTQILRRMELCVVYMTLFCEVDEKKLAALPVGLFGIFRGLGIEGKHINRHLQELQNGNLLLILREEVNSLKAIEKVLHAL